MDFPGAILMFCIPCLLGFSEGGGGVGQARPTCTKVRVSFPSDGCGNITVDCCRLAPCRNVNDRFPGSLKHV